MRYTQGLFMVIIFKAITVFFVLVATSFITLSYEMVDFSDDIYYRIFIQIIFAIAIIFMYMKRSFVMDMLQGAAPNLGNTGTGEGMGRRGFAGLKGGAGKGKRGLQKTGSGIKKTGSGIKKAGSGAKAGIAKTAGITSIAGKKASDLAKNSRGKVGAQMNKSKDHIGKVENGEIPNQNESPYHTDEASTNEQENIGNVKSANFGNSGYKNQSSNQLNNQTENATIQSENVNVNSSNKRNPRNVTPIKANTNEKSNLSQGTTNARKPKTMKDNANKVKNTTGSRPSDDKPITQWEAQQQLKQKNKSANKQTSRNPYQHINEKNQSRINQKNNSGSMNNKDGMLNKRSLLHGNKKE